MFKWFFRVRPRHCGFCCGETTTRAMEHEGKTVWFVICLNCKASGPEKPTEAEAIDRWNYLMERLDG